MSSEREYWFACHRRGEPVGETIKVVAPGMNAAFAKARDEYPEHARDQLILHSVKEVPGEQ